jgi:type VI protein secretion system component VasK
MRLVNWLAFLLTLAVALISWGLIIFEPQLRLGSPWGSFNIGFLIAGAYILGALVASFYMLAYWLSWRRTLRSQRSALAQVQKELESLRQARIQEVPVIPDRPQGEEP